MNFLGFLNVILTSKDTRGGKGDSTQCCHVDVDALNLTLQDSIFLVVLRCFLSETG